MSRTICCTPFYYREHQSPALSGEDSLFMNDFPKLSTRVKQTSLKKKRHLKQVILTDLFLQLNLCFFSQG